MTSPILIADTNEATRDQLKKILSNRFPLIVVESPEYALKCIDNKRTPSLILMGVDQSINDKNISTFTLLRKAFPSIHLIALGERNEEPESIEAVRTGASGYMIKPLNTIEVLSLAEKSSTPSQRLVSGQKIIFLSP